MLSTSLTIYMAGTGTRRYGPQDFWAAEALLCHQRWKEVSPTSSSRHARVAKDQQCQVSKRSHSSCYVQLSGCSRPFCEGCRQDGFDSLDQRGSILLTEPCSISVSVCVSVKRYERYTREVSCVRKLKLKI
jgi:hypothetical protein